MDTLFSRSVDFQELFANAAAGLVLCDMRTRRYLFANRVFQRLTGYSEEELRELTIDELNHPEERVQDLERHKALLAGRLETYEARKRYLRKDGQAVWVRVTGSAIRKDMGQPEYVWAVVLDDADAGSQQEKLAKKELQLEVALQASHAVSWSWDPAEGEPFEPGPGFYELYGLSTDTPPTISVWTERIHPDDRGRVHEALRQLLDSRDKHEWREEFRIVHPEKGERWLWGLGRLERDAAGNPLRLSGVNLDITDRKLTELLREQHARRLRAFISSAPVALAMFDAQFRYLAVSSRWRADFVPGEQPVIGLRHDQLGRACFSSNPSQWQGMLARALGGEVVRFDEERWTCLDGRVIWVRGEIQPWYEKTAEVGGIVVFAEDFTSLRELTTHLQENKQNLERQVDEQNREMALLQRAISSLGEGVAIVGGDFGGTGPRFQFVNDTLCRMTGYRREELLGAPRSIFFGEKTDINAVKQMVAKLEAGESARTELVYYRKDGTTFLGEIFITPLVDSRGDFTQFVAIVRDVTERKEAELKLRDSEERWRAIFENAFNAIVTIDLQGRIVAANPATEKMFGYSSEELIGQNVAVLSPLSAEDHNYFLQRYLQTGKARLVGASREVFARRKDGTIFPVDISISATGHHGFTGIMRDISELRELQQHVLEAGADEQRRIGQELHDNIQQQLTGLGLYAATAEKMLADLQPEEMQESLSWRMDDGALQKFKQLLSRMTWGLAEANRQIRALSHGIMPVQIDAQGVAAALQDLVEGLNQKHGVHCEFHCPTAVSLPNNTIATHLYRIAQEALGNALRHSKATQIRVTLRTQIDGIELEVRDNGTGLSDSPDRPSEGRFTQTDLSAASGERSKDNGLSTLPDARDRNSGRGKSTGVGMGIRLMKYRVNLLGGELDLVSSLGSGTIVRCRIPVSGEGVND